MTQHSQLTQPEDGINREKAQRATRLLLEALGEDPDRPGLADTWERRVPDAFATLTDGIRENEKPTMRTFDAEADGLVVKTDIPFYSLCEHHLLPFHGTVHVAYRPRDKVVGLSKVARYVRWQSRQLTMQERLTNDIASGLAEELNVPLVLVEMDATHLCEAMRGIETKSTTITQTTVGEPTAIERAQFRTAVARAEGRQ
ncbi:GTP cyclohydrolase I [Saliphagus sp. LR7]|uniref:GTP cyclohydrolase I n=1 Tax=Saliphagus sp. LR7 TaxID=2282654 RepID=UPI000DF802AF|nr:GTP cyclohydrolase I [Saliphagus sp. LR7]